MNTWVMLTAIVVNVVAIIGAIVAVVKLILKFGAWEERLTKMYKSIENIEAILSDQAESITDLKSRVSYIEGRDNSRK